MEARAAGFQAFRQDTTPLIILEGVEPPINNERLRAFFHQFNPTRCRIVFRNGKCMKFAGIEFSNHEDARRALDFSRRITIDGFQVRSRPGTDKDREWWMKKRPNYDSSAPMQPNSPEHSPRNAFSHFSPIEPVNNPNRYANDGPMGGFNFRQPTMNPKALQGNRLENISPDQLEYIPFVIIACERSVNLSEGPRGELVFPYEISLVKFRLNQLAHTAPPECLFHRLVDSGHIPNSLTVSSIWCNTNLGSPDYNFNLGERDYGKIWREINDFLLPDHQSAPPILFAKGPHVVNSALFWLAQNSGMYQKLGADFVPPFGYASEIEDLVMKLFYVSGRSITSSQVLNFFSPPSPEQLFGIRCPFHESDTKRARCSLANCRLLFTTLFNITKIVELK